MAKPASNYDPVQEPEFCPNPQCQFHNPVDTSKSAWFIKRGRFYTKGRGWIQRFSCSECGRSCSTQTFSLHYWTHSTVDFEMLDNRIYACSGYRQIGRDISLSYNALKNRQQRLARNYLNLFDAALSDFPLPENIAFDGFESYLRSQNFPNNFNIAVGCESRIPYLFNLALMRRKGRMTETQKQKRDLIDHVWRPRERELIERTKEVFREIFALYLNRPILSPFSLYTDQKTEYVVALKELPEVVHLSELGLFEHKTTSSRAERTMGNPLFPVNYLDREIRKNSSSHARETVRADKEANMAITKMLIIFGHHTFRKPFKINNFIDIDAQETHADKVHLLESLNAKNAFKRLYTHRHMWSHQKTKTLWCENIWQMKEDNPPIIDFTTGEAPEKGQPGAGWRAKHLIA